MLYTGNANFAHLGIMANPVGGEFSFLPEKNVEGKANHGNAEEDNANY